MIAIESPTFASGAAVGDLTLLKAKPALVTNAAPALTERIKLILSRVDTLPPLPSVASKLLSIQSPQSADMNEIIKMIETDPGLASRLLAMCRRADRGLGDRITTVKRAVLMLGFDVVRSTALSLSVYKMLGEDDERSRRDLDDQIGGSNSAGAPEPQATAELDGLRIGGFDSLRYWKFCIATACAAEVIALLHPRWKVQGAEAFLAGLLHGVGRIVLERIVPNTYSGILRLARQRNTQTRIIEQQMLGLDYRIAGHQVAKKWNLPDEVGEAALLHADEPVGMSMGDLPPMVAIVSCARAVTRSLHIGWSGDYSMTPDAALMWKRLGFDQSIIERDSLASVADKVFTSTAERFDILGLSPKTPQALMMESLGAANLQTQRQHDDAATLARQQVGQKIVLDSLLEFQSRRELAREQVEVARMILRSAAECSGGRKDGNGLYALVWRSQGSAQWQMLQFSMLKGQEGPVGMTSVAGPPLSSDAVRSLMSTRAGGGGYGKQTNSMLLGLHEWLKPLFPKVQDPRTLRTTLLTPTLPKTTDRATAAIGKDGAGLGEGGPLGVGISLEPAALLVCDQEINEATCGGLSCLSVLVDAWSRAIVAAGHLPLAKSA